MMEFSEEIKRCVEVLNAGGLILYPTDTVWGIGCDATNEAAVQKIFTLKKRNEAKSLISLVNNAAMLNKCVRNVPGAAWDIIEFSEKPITIIYDEPAWIALNAIADDQTAAIRLTNDEFCAQLLYRFRKPIISTSANISSETAPSIFQEVALEIKNGVDYIVKHRQGDRKRAAPSSIIQIKNSGVIKIIRK
jgi:L-threonylcarbamoyladenylate synthase